MRLHTLTIRQFRCFERLNLTFDPQCTVIAGPNGSGKTSVLEAIHVAGYMRSFRTPTLKDLIAQRGEAFSVRATCIEKTEQNEIHIGYGQQTRVAELNGQPITRRKELFSILPVVTITEQDIVLIQGYPENRRDFVDQVAFSSIEGHSAQLQRYTQILKQRNALLYDQRAWHPEVYAILTDEAWRLAQTMRESRNQALQMLFARLIPLCVRIVPECASLAYTYKIADREQKHSGPESWCRSMIEQERLAKKSLFGPHLDDLLITMHSGAVQRFASRGMQKLLAVLLRVAQALVRPNAVILLDDIMADFDERRLYALLETLETIPAQLIFTVPTSQDTLLTQWARKKAGLIIELPDLSP